MARAIDARQSWSPCGATANTDYYLAANDIMVVVPRKGEKDDVTTAKANVELQMGYARSLGRACGFIVILSGLASQDAGARRVYADGMEPALSLGTALVVTSPLSRAIASFFLGLTRPRIRTQVFDSYENARHWLESLRVAEEAS